MAPTLLKCTRCGDKRFGSTPPPPSWFRSGIARGAAATAAVLVVLVGAYLYWLYWPPDPKPAPDDDTPGPVAGPADPADCVKDKEPRAIVAGCTAILKGPPPAAERLAQVYLLRGYAYTQLRDFAKALDDYGRSFDVAPEPRINVARARLYMQAAKFNEAALQLDQASARIVQRETGNPTAEQREALKQLATEIAALQAEMTLSRIIEPLWVAYLKEIQGGGPGAYGNWSGPPYDLYLQNRKVP